MSDLEMNEAQIGDSTPAEEQAQTDQVLRSADSFDVDFDPPVDLTPPPR